MAATEMSNVMALTLPPRYKFVARPVPAFAKCPSNHVRKVRMKDVTPTSTFTPTTHHHDREAKTDAIEREIEQHQKRVESKRELLDYYANQLENMKNKSVRDFEVERNKIKREMIKDMEE
jgi:hypothetical protein